MGVSYWFAPIRDGYYSAYSKILEIKQKDHEVGGDVDEVLDYCG